MTQPATSPAHSSGHDCAAVSRLRRLLRRAAMPVLVSAWIVVVSGGMWVLSDYEHKAGATPAAPDLWPRQTNLVSATDRSTLVMFAHPKCPCTRASIGELERIMTACHGDVVAYAVFVKPPQCSEQTGWEKTDLWNSANRIPGVTALVDGGGIEASRFGAATSGDVLLYDAQGRLRFRGGITASRGHSGDNLGRSAIVTSIRHGFADVDRTQVYGCDLGTPLKDSSTSCCQK